MREENAVFAGGLSGHYYYRDMGLRITGSSRWSRSQTSSRPGACPSPNLCGRWTATPQPGRSTSG
ncbi:MAG: hypothetical protein WBL10_10060 [Candidatus Methanoculleus thermohydrogenotrophicum]